MQDLAPGYGYIIFEPATRSPDLRLPREHARLREGHPRLRRLRRLKRFFSRPRVTWKVAVPAACIPYPRKSMSLRGRALLLPRRRPDTQESSPVLPGEVREGFILGFDMWVFLWIFFLDILFPLLYVSTIPMQGPIILEA